MLSVKAKNNTCAALRLKFNLERKNERVKRHKNHRTSSDHCFVPLPLESIFLALCTYIADLEICNMEI